jgi:uncharacterized membrane protein
MLRIVYAILLGLVGAGIVHIAILLLLPALSDRDAWSRLAAAGDLYSFVRLGGEPGSAPVVTSADPHFEAMACRFDLSEGAAHVQAEGRTPFWSISVYNRAGQNIYSFNDRTATDGILDLVLATPAQVIALRRSLPPDLEQSIIVEVGSSDGIVVLRGFIPDESWRDRVDDYLTGAQCASLA